MYLLNEIPVHTSYNGQLTMLASCHLLALVSKLNSSGGRSRASELVSPLCNQADPSRPNEYEYGWIRSEYGTLTQLITLDMLYAVSYFSVLTNYMLLWICYTLFRTFSRCKSHVIWMCYVLFGILQYIQITRCF